MSHGRRDFLNVHFADPSACGAFSILLDSGAMQLIHYLGHLGDAKRRAFAQRARTTVGYLRQVGYGYRRCGGALARRIEDASRGAVRADELRPDLFGRRTTKKGRK